jgi:hypothetical protein
MEASYSGTSVHIKGEATIAEAGINVGDPVQVMATYNPISKQWRTFLKTKVKVDGE